MSKLWRLIVSYRKQVEKKLLRRERRYETERLMKKKRSEEYEVLEEVFDRSTLMNIYHFLKEGTIDEIHGAVGAGKESKLYWGKDKDGNEIAVKIFLMVSAEFKRGMIPYIEGDRRFAKVKKSTRSLVFAWTRKEFINLKQAYAAQVDVPKPIDVRQNVLIMEFIGEKGVSAPLLREAKVSNPAKVYEQVLTSLRKMYQKAKLIHGDLSEYNIMIWRGKPIIFDVSQAVPVDHPMADQLLRRDLNNLNHYFKRLGVEVHSAEESYRRITVGRA
jgi:RIO kinase 1